MERLLGKIQTDMIGTVCTVFIDGNYQILRARLIRNTKVSDAAYFSVAIVTYVMLTLALHTYAKVSKSTHYELS